MALLDGCEIVHEAPIDPAKFGLPGASGNVKLPGRAAVVVLPAVAALKTEVVPNAVLAGYLYLPLGEIVATALLLALDAEFEDGAQRLDALPAAMRGFTAVAEMTAPAIDIQVRRSLGVPIPLPYLPLAYERHDIAVSVAFDLQVVDGRSRPLGARRCDAGAQHAETVTFGSESGGAAIVRLTHEAAGASARLAARELHAALEPERMQPRTL